MVMRDISARLAAFHDDRDYLEYQCLQQGIKATHPCGGCAQAAADGEECLAGAQDVPIAPQTTGFLPAILAAEPQGGHADGEVSAPPARLLFNTGGKVG